MRSADLARILKKYQTKDSTVAKLFAKHIKLKEAVEDVKKMRMGIGCGTPQRIIDLLENGKLVRTSLAVCLLRTWHRCFESKLCGKDCC